MRSLIYDTPWPQPVLPSATRSAGGLRLKFRKLLGKPQAQTCSPQGLLWNMYCRCPPLLARTELFYVISSTIAKEPSFGTFGGGLESKIWALTQITQVRNQVTRSEREREREGGEREGVREWKRASGGGGLSSVSHSEVCCIQRVGGSGKNSVGPLRKSWAWIWGPLRTLSLFSSPCYLLIWDLFGSWRAQSLWEYCLAGKGCFDPAESASKCLIPMSMRIWRELSQTLKVCFYFSLYDSLHSIK